MAEAERLSAADASNVVMDARDQVNVYLLAGVLGAGGFVASDAAVDLDVLRAKVSRRLADDPDGALRRFRQRIGTDGGDYVWEACAPDFGWHIRLTDPVAGEAGLAELCGRLMTAPLQPDRPLWELLVVPGAGAYPGMVLRVHHAVADGVAVVQMVQHLLGQDPPPRPAARPDGASRAQRKPSLRLSIVRVLSILRRAVPPTVLLGPIGPHRGIGLVSTELAAVAAGARTAEATLNDAFLAAVGPAVEAVLAAAGQPILPTVPVSVPVALPDRGSSGNAVGVMLVRLRTGQPDVTARLRTIAALTTAGKAEARAQGTFELTRSRWAATLYAWLARRQRLIAVFVTNVRGPAEKLTLAGAPIERAWPVVPIQGNVRFGVAAFSYAGRLNCCVHVDADHLDAQVAATTLGEEFNRIARLGTEPAGFGQAHPGRIT